MKALLLIAHGSRNQEFNDEIGQLTQRLESLDHGFELSAYAFLEMADPDINTAIEDLVGRGAIDITILPYFLARGNHVLKDIPNQISQIQSKIPNVKLNMVAHIGNSDDMPNLIIQHLTNSNR